MITKEKVQKIVYILQMPEKQEAVQYFMSLSREELIDICALMIIGRSNNVDMRSFCLEREGFDESHQEETNEHLVRYLTSKKSLVDYLRKSIELYLDEGFIF